MNSTTSAGGERLFDGVEALHALAMVKAVVAPDVIHLQFARK
ncbi:hypothetical protein [Variovorax sp. VRV01]|nr:hypothetical protein [Variovorax sp. VRV01]